MLNGMAKTHIHSSNRHGISMVYAMALMVVLFGITSFAVDFGRLQLARSEAQTAATAAARYGAALLASGNANAIAAAMSAAGQNKIDGVAFAPVAATDIELGVWNISTKTFTATNTQPNAVRVYARRTAARGNAIPTIFAQVLGVRSIDINIDAIAMRKPPIVIENDVPATASPFLAGMPDGTVSSQNNPANNPDSAPNQNPVQVTGLTLTPGDALTFDHVAGGANNDFRWSERFNPDGNIDWVIDNYTGRELGKSNMRSPINALVGVFLTDADPRTQTTPEDLNFSTAAQRNFSQLSPKVGQIFFIGDGKQDDGTPQRFVVPAGATRFYVANWDGWEWNNNIGLRTTRITRLSGVTTVK
jgi:Flp pilus assembly protein TadG